jgi:hypothetical protein
MAARIAFVGLVTVSLRKSIIVSDISQPFSFGEW